MVYTPGGGSGLRGGGGARGGRGGGGGRGGARGFGRGRGGGGRGRGGGGGGGGGAYRGGYDDGPPASVEPMGMFAHPCEKELVVKSTNEKVPYFNAPIYLENKTQVGKVEEIFGPISEVHFTVKPSDGVVAASFKLGDKLFINPEKLLPLQRFLAKPTATRGVRKPGGRGRGGGDRGRGGFRGGGGGGFRGGGGGGFRGGGGGGFRGGARGGGGFRGGGGRGGGGFRGR